MNSVRIRFTRTASRLITLKSNGEFLGFRFRSRYRHRNNLRFGEHTTPRAAAVALWPALVLGAAEHDSDSSSNLQRFQSIYRSTASLRDIPRLVGDAVQDVSSRARSSFQERMESEGGNVTSNITSVNVAVYILWKIAPTGIMVR